MKEASGPPQMREVKSSFHERFAGDPGALRVLALPEVAAAIGTGDPSRVHAALRRARGGSVSAADRGDIDRVLADRRAFLKSRPPPTLFTFNGIGTRLLGGEDANPDGTYVGTRWFTVLYVPVFPLGSHLVVPDGKGWRFFGTVPLAPGKRVARRVGLGLVTAALLFFGWRVYASATHGTVRLLNGLDIAVTTEFGGRTLRLEPDSRLSEDFPRGPAHVRTRTDDGYLVEEMDVDVRGGSSFAVYSVLGAAPLHVQEVVYTDKTVPPDTKEPRDTALSARPWVVFDPVDFAFEDPPKTINLKKSHRLVKRWAYLAPGGWRTALSEAKQRGASYVESACAIATAGPGDDDALHWAVEAADATGPDRVRRLAEDLRTRTPTSIESIRGSQWVYTVLGELDRLVSQYRAEYERDRSSVQAGYLYARLLPSADAMEVLPPLLAAHPDDPWLLRSTSYSLHLLGRHAEAVEHYERLARVDPKSTRRTLVERARSLVMVHRTRDAQRLALDQVGPDDWGALTLYAKLARLPDADPMLTSPETLIRRVVPHADKTAGLRAELAGFSRDRRAFDRFAEEITSPHYREACRICVDSVWNLPSAAAAARAASPEVLALLDLNARVALACEILRNGEEGAAKRVYGSVGAPKFEALRDPAAVAQSEDLDSELRATLLVAAARSAPNDTERDRLLATARVLDTFHCVVPD